MSSIVTHGEKDLSEIKISKQHRNRGKSVSQISKVEQFCIVESTVTHLHLSNWGKGKIVSICMGITICQASEFEHMISVRC